MFLEAFLSQGNVTTLLSRLKLTPAKLWYAIDFVYIAAYTVALCVLVLYLRKRLAERTMTPQIHRLAYWAGLIPIWILIGSDIIENILSLWLLYHPTTACHEGAWVCWLLAGFTSLKYLSLLAIAVIFATWGLYCFSGTKGGPVNAGQVGPAKN